MRKFQRKNRLCNPQPHMRGNRIIYRHQNVYTKGRSEVRSAGYSYAEPELLTTTLQCENMLPNKQAVQRFVGCALAISDAAIILPYTMLLFAAAAEREGLQSFSLGRQLRTGSSCRL